MDSLQTFRNFVSYTLPANTQTWHGARLELRLVIPPVQSERNIEKCPRKDHKFVQSQRRSRVGEKLIVAHCQERLSVHVGKQQQRWPH